MPPEAARVAGVAGWMGAWWITEVVPLAATSLLPIVLFPALSVRTTAEAAAPYANELIFLFLSGFLLATALERWNSHQRIAYRLIQLIGTGTRRVILGIMVATAFLSMWMSNTATAAMMLPIALAIGSLFGGDDAGRQARRALLLGVGFAATLGGMGTLIGTPPNLILAGAIRELTGVPLDFGRFMLLGVPVTLILVPATWALLVFGLYRNAGPLADSAASLIAERRRALGPIPGGEALVLTVFTLTATSWIMREPKELGAIVVPGLTSLIPGASDATIGLAAAVLLFTLRGRARDGSRRPLLLWEEACRIPWDVLLLFGGGLSLAAAMESSDLSAWIGERLVGLRGLPLPLLILSVAAVIVLLSEFASNTAVAAMMMPLAAALADGLGQPPALLILIAGFSASLGFALPIATPPNAIVFGSGQIPIRHMIRAGLLLDLMGVLVVTALLSALAPVVLNG
jgi:sodium-dependent dicarboxylate transporter 2/3/5